MSKKLQEFTYKLYQTRVCEIKVMARNQSEADKKIEFQSKFYSEAPMNPWEDKWTPTEVHSEIVSSKNNDVIIKEFIEKVASLVKNSDGEDRDWYYDLECMLRKKHFKKAANHCREGDTFLREALPDTLWSFFGAKGYL
jgi:hypothetical protein